MILMISWRKPRNLSPDSLFNQPENPVRPRMRDSPKGDVQNICLEMTAFHAKVFAFPASVCPDTRKLWSTISQACVLDKCSISICVFQLSYWHTIVESDCGPINMSVVVQIHLTFNNYVIYQQPVPASYGDARHFTAFLHLWLHYWSFNRDPYLFLEINILCYTVIMQHYNGEFIIEIGLVVFQLLRYKHTKVHIFPLYYIIIVYIAYLYLHTDVRIV